MVSPNGNNRADPSRRLRLDQAERKMKLDEALVTFAVITPKISRYALSVFGRYFKTDRLHYFF
jgi:hypothetical protein